MKGMWARTHFKSDEMTHLTTSDSGEAVKVKDLRPSDFLRVCAYAFLEHSRSTLRKHSKSIPKAVQNNSGSILRAVGVKPPYVRCHITIQKLNKIDMQLSMSS